MKKIATGILVAGMSVTAAGTAFADQCAWITLNHAKAGVAIAKSHARVISFCEPCGEKKPSASKVRGIQKVAIVPKGNGLFAVKVNRTEVDLAYTFVSRDGVTFHNLAKMARCPASGVSRSIKLAPAAPKQGQAGGTGRAAPNQQ